MISLSPICRFLSSSEAFITSLMNFHRISGRSLSLRVFLRAPIPTRALATAPAPTLHPSESGIKPPHLLTLADLSVTQIQSLISSSLSFKRHYKKNAIPIAGRPKTADTTSDEPEAPSLALKSLDHKTVALIFNKRSTRTRVATESAVHMLGLSH